MGIKTNTLETTSTASDSFKAAGGGRFAGNVGIGTSSPLTILHAVGNLTLGAQNNTTQRIIATPDASVINTGTGALVVKAGQANSNTSGGSGGSLTLSGGDSNRTGSSNGTAGGTLVRGGDVLDGGVGSVEGAGAAGLLTLRGGDNSVSGNSSSSAGDLTIRGGNLSLKAGSNGRPGSVTIATGSVTSNGNSWGGSAPFIAFQTGTTSVTESLRITSTGNVGIGTTSPTARLHVAGGKVKVDDTTEATTTTDGSLQTDGGLSVAKNIVSGGNITGTQFRLSALNTAPANAGATGTLGEIRIVDGYIYVCVATNTWKRAEITTW